MSIRNNARIRNPLSKTDRKAIDAQPDYTGSANRRQESNSGRIERLDQNVARSTQKIHVKDIGPGAWRRWHYRCRIERTRRRSGALKTTRTGVNRIRRNSDLALNWLAEAHPPNPAFYTC